MDSERIARLKVVVTEMDVIKKEISPKLIRLTHLRKEAEQIVQEIKGSDDAQR